jgi:hypothetical protein
MPPKTLLRALPWGPALKTSPILMGDQIPRVLSDSSSDYSLDLSLLIVRQTRPGRWAWADARVWLYRTTFARWEVFRLCPESAKMCFRAGARQGLWVP